MKMTCLTKDKLQTRLAELREYFESITSPYLPSPDTDCTSLYAAMSYAVKNGGKRLRPILVYLTGELLGLPMTSLNPCAVSVELIHTYSLIHDDLPAMDNSPMRRGQPTCHLAYNEAIAILAGDCLQTLAFEILATHPNPGLSATQRLQILTILTHVSGFRGMGGGQAQDLYFTGKPRSETELLHMYHLKTGALIQACIELPAQYVALTSNQHQALRMFGYWLGLAFQIQDDILDCEADSKSLGKPQYLDAHNNKHTLINAIGMTQAKIRSKQFAANAIKALRTEFKEAQTLIDLTHYLSTRRT